MWLFFRHKLEYLHETVRHRPSRADAFVRYFCIPQEAVDRSSSSERVLLLLTFALMEALGIETRVLPMADPARSGGFVLFPKAALVADWLTAEGLWRVDSLGDPRAVRRMAGQVAFADANALSSTSTSGRRRLEVFASYLSIDWPWLRRRARQLLAADVRGLLVPRSRLLTVDGVEIALEYIAEGRMP
jgi:hypothetical protein